MAAQKIRLYYFREAGKITTLLNEIAAKEGSTLKNLTAKNITEDEIILYGGYDQRQLAWRVIAALDLPRPGVEMEMWGIQISSNKSEQMEKVMPAVRAQINSTQHAVRDAYAELEKLTRKSIPNDGSLNRDFRDLLVTDLGYTSALDTDRRLSLTDILLRMIAAQEAGSAAVQIAQGMDDWYNHHNQGFLVQPSCPKRLKNGFEAAPSRPFSRFFSLRGLERTDAGWVDRDARERAKQGRNLVADFGFAYGWLVHQPYNFSAYRLQQSADALNARLQLATDALNSDLDDLFVTPTLHQIGDIVRCYKDVEYAQVGKVSMATLSGVQTVVDAHSINAFDVTPPLRLSELLTKAKELSESVTPFDPAKNTVGALPLSQVIGLIAAFGENRELWRETKSGVSVTLTPNVLRNMTSAELKINLTSADPVVTTAEKGLRPLSRVSQHDIQTSIYVNALDFFDLSAFDNQAILGRGRGMVPIIGPIWNGLFGAIPVAGKFFSWQKSPKTVYTDSLILTNSFITPTPMGIALLYPTDFPCACKRKIENLKDDTMFVRTITRCFEDQKKLVESYKRREPRPTEVDSCATLTGLQSAIIEIHAINRADI